jgi:GDP-L-fucose synthase
MRSPNNATDLILGADGFLGRNLEIVLLANERRVACVERADGDLSHWDNVERVFRTVPKVERIFHVVTRQRTGSSQYGLQGELLAINARIHLNILEAWRQFQPQAKLISTGSSCAYPESNAPLPESAYQTGPLHASVKGYGLAKQVLAIGAQAYSEQYSLKHLHCILATLYGPGDHHEPNRSHFLGAMFHRAVEEKRAGKAEFTVWGSPGTTREVLHVEDQIAAILAADAAFDNAILNCAANEPITIKEAVDAILEVLDWRPIIVSPEASFQGTSFKVLDSSLFLARTGWHPRYSLVERLRQLYVSEYISS